jgi:ATP-dependent Clp protease ATP-binding subunit ClpC
MFERFSERARQAVAVADEEARALRHDDIGTEHILLGLLREQDGLAAQVLASLNITIESVRTQIRGSSREVKTSRLASRFTAPAKRVLELALREALSLGDRNIDTEHLLLGLDARAGRTRGTDPDRCRR